MKLLTKDLEEKLKEYPLVKVKNNYLSAKVRADIKQMHVYTEEAYFLFNNKITTKNELINYQEKIQEKLNELLGNREKLWKLRKYDWIHFNISISNRREVEVDMEKCKKRNTEHCTKSKFCAKRNRSKI